MSTKKPPQPTGDVLDFGLARIKKGMTPRPKHGVCRHINQTYDPVERRVWCNDCGDEIEAFDAYMVIVENYERASRSLEARRAEIAEAETKGLISRAAKAIDRVWRKRDSVPLCPHCGEGLLPEDILSGLAQASKAWIKKKRQK